MSTKWTRIEDAGELSRRVQDAPRHHPKDRLAIGPQCGFAPASETADARKITPQTQTDKLNLIGQVTRTLWSGDRH